MKWRGQISVEYGLLGALILLACLIPLARLGTVTSHSLTALIPSKSISAIHKQVVTSSSEQKADIKVTLKLSDGTSLILDNVSQDPASTIVTIGANGSTSSYANSLIDMAIALKQQNKIDEATYQDILNLANVGHDIANIERIIENVAKANVSHNNDAFVNTQVFVHGKVQTVQELSSTIGKLNESTDREMNSKTTAKLMALADKVRDRFRGEPALSAFIDSQVNNIDAISQSVQNTVHKIAVDSEPLSVFNKSVASRASNRSSENICHSGKFKDSGINCF